MIHTVNMHRVLASPTVEMLCITHLGMLVTPALSLPLIPNVFLAIISDYRRVFALGEQSLFAQVRLHRVRGRVHGFP